jgi:hypothetical protein
VTFFFWQAIGRSRTIPGNKADNALPVVFSFIMHCSPSAGFLQCPVEAERKHRKAAFAAL